MYLKLSQEKSCIDPLKNFCANDYIKDLSSVPFHVSEVFDDPSGQMWFHNKLLVNVINVHAPLKHKTKNQTCNIHEWRIT